MLHQRWFAITETQWLNFSHPFFLRMPTTFCDISNWVLFLLNFNLNEHFFYFCKNRNPCSPHVWSLCPCQRVGQVFFHQRPSFNASVVFSSKFFMTNTLTPLIPSGSLSTCSLSSSSQYSNWVRRITVTCRLAGSSSPMNYTLTFQNYFRWSRQAIFSLWCELEVA